MQKSVVFIVLITVMLFASAVYVMANSVAISKSNPISQPVDQMQQSGQIMNQITAPPEGAGPAMMCMGCGIAAVLVIKYAYRHLEYHREQNPSQLVKVLCVDRIPTMPVTESEPAYLNAIKVKTHNSPGLSWLQTMLVAQICKSHIRRKPANHQSDFLSTARLVPDQSLYELEPRRHADTKYVAYSARP